MNNKCFYSFVAIGFLLLSYSTIANAQFCTEYKRADWGYRAALSPHKEKQVGFYTNRRSAATDVDHIVSLSDAHKSGGCFWSAEEKRMFSNDPDNQVPAVPFVNRIIKKHHSPIKFIRRMQQNHNEFYDNMRKCMYVTRYRDIKRKYNLRITGEDSAFIAEVLKNCPAMKHIAMDTPPPLY